MKEAASSGRPESGRVADWLLVAAGLAASMVVLWIITGEPLVVAGFGAGIVAPPLDHKPMKCPISFSDRL